MPTISVTVKAVFRSRGVNRFFAAFVKVKNHRTGNTIEKEIPQAGGLFELESGARYDFDADPREDSFQGIIRSLTIETTTRRVDVRIAAMGEECRIWLEDIKQMIEKGEHQKAKKEIRLAKRVYKDLNPVPEEVVKILELEKEIPRV